VGHQGTKEEAGAGVGGAFMQVVHCVIIGNDSLVSVCDRQGDRIQVFDKMGDSKITFGSREEMYVDDGGDEQVKILDHASGEVLSSALGQYGRD
jgi:hypothetical protein